MSQWEGADHWGSDLKTGPILHACPAQLQRPKAAGAHSGNRVHHHECVGSSLRALLASWNKECAQPPRCASSLACQPRILALSLMLGMPMLIRPSAARRHPPPPVPPPAPLPASCPLPLVCRRRHNPWLLLNLSKRAAMFRKNITVSSTHQLSGKDGKELRRSVLTVRRRRVVPAAATALHTQACCRRAAWWCRASFKHHCCLVTPPLVHYTTGGAAHPAHPHGPPPNWPALSSGHACTPRPRASPLPPPLPRLPRPSPR